MALKKILLISKIIRKLSVKLRLTSVDCSQLSVINVNTMVKGKDNNDPMTKLNNAQSSTAKNYDFQDIVVV